jgi:lipoate-protein ligase B
MNNIPSTPTCSVNNLGLIEYGKALELQKQILAQKAAGKEENFLLLLEHPPTLTLGLSGKLENLHVGKDDLSRRNIPLFYTDRGGDITYHGPGQLVAYPIIDLRRRGRDIHRYIFDLQEVVIKLLADYSIIGQRDPKYVGVWVGGKKICAIGVAVHKWITMHGLALNVDPDLNAFSLITPCGITERGVTSMAEFLKNIPSMKEMMNRFTLHFSRVFSANMEEGLTGL